MQLRDQRFADLRIIDDAFLRDAQRRHAAHVRLDLAHLLARPASAGLPGRWRAALVQGRAGAALRSSSAATTSLPQISCGIPFSRQNSTIWRMPVDRQARLHRARLVVQAAVQHAAVVAGLMAADARLLFEHGDARAGKALGKR